jgi:hypothetical protein
MDFFFLSRIVCFRREERRPSISRRGGAVVNAQKADLLPEDASETRDMMLSLTLSSSSICYSVYEYAKCSFNEGFELESSSKKETHSSVCFLFSLLSSSKNERVVT